MWISKATPRHGTTETRLWPSRRDAISECMRVFGMLVGTDAPLDNPERVMEAGTLRAWRKFAGVRSTDEWYAYVGVFQVERLRNGAKVRMVDNA